MNRTALRRRVAIALAILVSVAAAVAWTIRLDGGPDATGTSTVSRVRTGVLPVGIALGDSLFGHTTATIRTTLRDVHSVGATWIRIDMSWADLQPENAHSFTWAPLDRIVRIARQEHLHVLGVITYTPAWARAPGCDIFTCPPGNDLQFASFAGDVARRYRAAGVTHFEIWNEPNLNLFWKHPDPVAYRNLLTLTVSSMRSANPHVFVILGGLAATISGPNSIEATTFLQRACVHSRCPVSAVADHPYTFPEPPQDTSEPLNNWQVMASTHQGGMRHVMRQVGLATRPLWVTEYGAPTRYPGAKSTAVSPRQQAAIIVDGLRLAAGNRHWIGAYFIDTWKDLSARGSLAEHFGLIDVHGVRKPSYYALRSALGR